MKKTLNSIKILTLAVFLSFGLQYAIAAWSDPTTTPPGGNTPAPINVSSTTQTKTGGIIAWGGGVFTGNGIWANQYCDENGANCNPITTLAGGGGGAGSVPSGMIAMFAGSCPTGWSEYTAMQGRVPRGEPTGNPGSLNSGGSDNAIVVSHNHSGSVSGNTSNAGNHKHWLTGVTWKLGDGRQGGPMSVIGGWGGKYTSSNGNHNHSFNVGFNTNYAGSSGAGKNIPAYQEVIFCVSA